MKHAHEEPTAPAESRAWIWNQPGEPSGLQLVSRASVPPGPGEVLVANRAIALNPIDWKVVATGRPAWRPGQVPGVDGVGVVAAVGAGVSLKPGTRVAYHQDVDRDGSFAAHTTVAARAVLPVPAGLSDAAAATLPCPALTAWQALDKVPPALNRDVLVTGGGGAVGFYLVQLALARGWRVWATAGPDHHERLRAFGVVDAFDYREPGWREELRAALGPRPLFAAFDTVGEAHARSLVPLLGYSGHLVCIQDRLSQPATPAFAQVLSQHEVALNALYRHGTALDWQALREAGARLLEHLACGVLQPPAVIGFDFGQLPAALADLKAGRRSGKFIATLPANP